MATRYLQRYLYFRRFVLHIKIDIFQTSVMYSTYTACRDPKYVEDPTSFKPERWARDSPTSEELDAFLSLPFGFGPRSCYGDVQIKSSTFPCTVVY